MTYEALLALMAAIIYTTYPNQEDSAHDAVKRAHEITREIEACGLATRKPWRIE